MWQRHILLGDVGTRKEGKYIYQVHHTRNVWFEGGSKRLPN